MMPHHPEAETDMTPEQRAFADALIEIATRTPSVHPEAQHTPTSVRVDVPDSTGAQPVPQHDPSFWGHVPKWALGVAVAGPASGVTAVGFGYASQLFFTSVTTEGIVMVGVIAAGAAWVIGAAGGFVKKLGAAAAELPTPTTNNFHGSVTVENNTLVQQDNKALSFNRTRIDGGTK